MTDEQINSTLLRLFPGKDSNVNFCEDLNEMQRVESCLYSLGQHKYDLYFFYLANAVRGSKFSDGVTASARQKAEAALRAVGRWTGASL